MAHLQYSNWEGIGQKLSDENHYSQAVRIGDRIECAGQTGLDPETEAIPDDLGAEIEQAFKNVELTLKVRDCK